LQAGAPVDSMGCKGSRVQISALRPNKINSLAKRSGNEKRQSGTVLGTVRLSPYAPRPACRPPTSFPRTSPSASRPAIAAAMRCAAASSGFKLVRPPKPVGRLKALGGPESGSSLPCNSGNYSPCGSFAMHRRSFFSAKKSHLGIRWPINLVASDRTLGMLRRNENCHKKFSKPRTHPPKQRLKAAVIARVESILRK